MRLQAEKGHQRGLTITVDILAFSLHLYITLSKQVNEWLKNEWGEKPSSHITAKKGKCRLASLLAHDIMDFSSLDGELHHRVKCAHACSGQAGRGCPASRTGIPAASHKLTTFSSS